MALFEFKCKNILEYLETRLTKLYEDERKFTDFIVENLGKKIDKSKASSWNYRIEKMREEINEEIKKHLPEILKHSKEEVKKFKFLWNCVYYYYDKANK